MGKLRSRGPWIPAALVVFLQAAVGCSGVDRDDNNNQNGNQNGNQNTNGNNNNASQDVGTLTGDVSTVVTCDASATTSDCQGTLYLVVMAENPVTNPYQTPEAVKILPGADLSSGNTVAYTIEDLAVGTWYLSGFLDDDANASATLPSPDVGDPIGYPAPQITITKDQTTTEDIVLTMRMP